MGSRVGAGVVVPGVLESVDVGASASVPIALGGGGLVGYVLRCVLVVSMPLLFLLLLRVMLPKMKRVVEAVMMILALVVTVLVVGASRLQCRSEESEAGYCQSARYPHRPSLGRCFVVLG